MNINKFKLLGATAILACSLPLASHANPILVTVNTSQHALAGWNVDTTTNPTETRKIKHDNEDFFQQGKTYINITVNDFNEIKFQAPLIFTNKNGEPVIANIPVVLPNNEQVSLYVTMSGDVIQQGSSLNKIEPGNYKISLSKGYGLISDGFSTSSIKGTWSDEGKDHLVLDKVHLYSEPQLKALENIKSINEKNYEEKYSKALITMLGIFSVLGISGYLIKKDDSKKIAINLESPHNYPVLR